jgi:hypothetical protein
MDIAQISAVPATLPNLTPVELAQNVAPGIPPNAIAPTGVGLTPTSNSLHGAVVQSQLMTQIDKSAKSAPLEKVLKPYGITILPSVKNQETSDH